MREKASLSSPRREARPHRISQSARVSKRGCTARWRRKNCGFSPSLEARMLSRDKAGESGSTMSA